MHQDSIADPYGCQVSASYSFACKGVIFPAKCKEKREEGHLLPGGPDFHITSPASMSLKMSLDLNESFLPFFFLLPLPTIWNPWFSFESFLSYCIGKSERLQYTGHLTLKIFIKFSWRSDDYVFNLQPQMLAHSFRKNQLHMTIFSSAPVNQII